MISFLALSLAPGDPLTARLDPAILAELQRNPEVLAQRRHELGLDQPIPVRYVVWLGGIVRGDLGYSITSHTPISEEISKRVGPTLLLAAICPVVSGSVRSVSFTS